jgi:predicted restriction endonuclease
MPFPKKVKRKIVINSKTEEHLPCVMCGRRHPLPDAVHIIDEKEFKEVVGANYQVNGIPLCPNCHRVFDDILRPYLYRALEAFGVDKLPLCWKSSNKLAEKFDNLLQIDTP